MQINFFFFVNFSQVNLIPKMLDVCFFFFDKRFSIKMHENENVTKPLRPNWLNSPTKEEPI